MPSVDEEVLEKSFEKTGNALSRLGELVAMPAEKAGDGMLVDATIKRFEFSYEMLWKLFRKIHLLRGATTRRAYEAFKEAGAAGWLKHRELWLAMIKDRNISVHTYNELDANAIFNRIRNDYYPEMQRAYDFVKAHFGNKELMENWKERPDA